MEADFNFQEWALLAKLSPDEFERRRQETIQSFLESSGKEQRKLGQSLQREIDYEIRRSDSPQDALTAISRMMWAQVAFLGEELETLSDCMREFEVSVCTGTARLAAATRTAQAVESRSG